MQTLTTANRNSPCEFLLLFLSRRLFGANSDAGRIDSHLIFREYAIREINLLLWLSFFVATGFLLRKVFWVFKVWSYGGRIPGPPCPSFYGHSLLFLGSNSQQTLTELLVRSHEKYGSIVKLWMSPTQLLVSVKEPSVIHEMMSKAADKLPLTGRVYRLGFGPPSSFFGSSFEKVRKGRDSLAMELNGKMLEKANFMSNRLVDSVMERTSDQIDEGTLDCELFSQHIAFSILGATVFGDLFFAWSKGNVYEYLLIRIAKDACFWASYSVPPFWKRGYWKYQNLCTKLKSLTQDLVQQRCPNYKLSCQSSSTNRDLESAMKLGNSTSQESFGHLNLWGVPCGDVMGLMFHGCIPAGAMLVAPIHIVHMDESNWGSDAGQFNPYRFLAKAEKKSELGRSSKTTGAPGVCADSGEGSYILSDPFKNDAFLPFGSGIRACIGQKFTVLGIASAFASLLERYEIRPVPEASLDPKPSTVNCVIHLLPSPKIVFIPRNT